MQFQRARVTVAARSFAALSGLAIVGSLAGCSGQSLAANVTGPKAESTQAAAPVDASPSATPTVAPTATPTAVPTATATTAAKPPAAAGPTAAPTGSPSASPTPAPTTASSTYADGNYSATGTYNSPGGKETIRVTLDLANDIVADLAVTSVHIDSTAANYENAFEGGIQAIVVGKDIDSLNVGPVAGSSLTSIGFDRAIATIKGLAKN
jgi:hypothetical protein